MISIESTKNLRPERKKKLNPNRIEDLPKEVSRKLIGLWILS